MPMRGPIARSRLDDWLAKAEYSEMPASLRAKVLSLSLPDRIAWQNIEAVQFAKQQKANGATVALDLAWLEQ
jgi:hypothetical protein